MQNGFTKNNCEQERLEEYQISALEQFKRKVNDILSVYHTDTYLLRWLKAKKYNPQQAEKMFRQHVKFRKKIGASIWGNYNLPKVIEDYANVNYIGLDKDGDFVIFCIAGNTDFRGMAYSLTALDAAKGIFFLLENAIHSNVERGSENKVYDRTLVLIIDLKDVTVSHLFDTRTFKHGVDILHTFQSNFPGLLKSCHVFNVPAYFYVFLNSVKPFIPDDIMHRVKFYADDSCKSVFLESIPEERLPVYLGGQGPDIGTATNGNLEEFNFKGKGEVPHSFYLKDGHLDIENEPGLLKISVKQGTSYIQQVQISEARSAIMWCFQTVKYNIDFGVYYVPHAAEGGVEGHIESIMRGQIPDSCDVIFPVKHVDSHVMPERGEITCEKTGMYVLHFDNTFSWMTPKELFYKAEIVPPVTISDGYTRGAARNGELLTQAAVPTP